MPQAGYVYMLHGIDTPYVKIGKSGNIWKRLQNIAQGVPFAVQLLSTQLVKDMDEAERRLLQEFAPYRTRGEWFALPPDVLARWPTAVALSIGSLEDIRVRRVPHNVESRIIHLLESGQAQTARELQRKIKHSHSQDIRMHLAVMLGQGFISATPSGRHTLYLVQPKDAVGA